MALKQRLGKTQTIPFNIASEDAVQMVIIFSGKNSGTVYQRFSYPSRMDSSGDPEWTDLDINSAGTVFSGVLSEETTMSIADDVLVADIKGWDAAGQTRVKRYEVLPLVSTAVETIEPLP